VWMLGDFVSLSFNTSTIHVFNGDKNGNDITYLFIFSKSFKILETFAGILNCIPGVIE
jgi:hypothetical protein